MDVGRTQASSVIAVVRSRAAVSATVTQSLTPSNESAPPFLPAADQVAPEIVPACPRPEMSASVGPLPASKEYEATREGGAGKAANVAVYVAGAAGAVIVCVWAPPFDQDENPYVVPASVCGETALTLLAEPMITVLLNGVAADVLPTTSCSPVGLEAKLSVTVCGSSRRVSVSVSPPASVAVRRSSR